MKKNCIYTFSLFLLVIIINACAKEEVNEVELVKNKFIGRWPLKVRILDTLTNGVSSKPDTTTVTPIDTLVFSNDGKLTSALLNTTYSFDAKAENVTYDTSPAITWHIDFLRINSIILSRSRTETVNGATVVYYTQEQLVK